MSLSFEELANENILNPTLIEAYNKNLKDRLTPVMNFGKWFAKREDIACITKPEYPSGSKVRQYLKMAQEQPNSPMLVGCSANSCMQVYVAAAAKLTGVKGIVYLPKRKTLTEATQYCLNLGVELNQLVPGYASVYKKKARERGIALGNYVRWRPLEAALDTTYQCQNLPPGIRRIIIPTGTGLTAAGVLAGLAKAGKFDVRVMALHTSTVAKSENITKIAANLVGGKLPSLEMVRLPSEYDYPEIAKLPDGTPLDPFYAAKVLPYVYEGDCLWVTGLRPICSMPLICQKTFSGWWWSDTIIKSFA